MTHAQPFPSPATGNLYAALRAAFPDDLGSTAVETDHGLYYSWRDLERASAMLANLLMSLQLPEGARVAVAGVLAVKHGLSDGRNPVFHRQRRTCRGGLHR